MSVPYGKFALSPPPLFKLYNHIDYFIRLLPVISSGTFSPITVKRVGARSASIPSERSFAFLSFSDTKITGTGLVVCAVKGEPSSLKSLSALPWSAVTKAARADVSDVCCPAERSYHVGQ